MIRGGGGRRVISRELSNRKRKAEEEEELADPEIAEHREKARQAEAKLSKKKKENDPLFQFIINSFREETERDLKRRELHPERPWGTSFRQQLIEAQDDDEYKTLLRDLRNLYRGEKPDAELKILAFVRRDRLQTERLAAKHGRDGVYITSPAADEADYRTHLPKKVAEVKRLKTEGG